MLKAASRKKSATVFMPATFDKKDQLEALVKGEKYYIHTYGCQANVRDEETMRGLLEDVGYTQTDKPEEASLIIINTCAVRENAEDKVYGEIGNLKHLRQKNKELVLAICAEFITAIHDIDISLVSIVSTSRCNLNNFAWFTFNSHHSFIRGSYIINKRI